jgi:hypothetical protein
LPRRSDPSAGRAIPEPLVFNIPIADGQASGVITVPAGSGRTILVRAYDANAIETHRGEAVVNVMAGANPPLTIVLYPLVGDVEIEVEIGELVVTVEPPSAVLRIGGSIQLAATITSGAGGEVEGEVQWGSAQPLVATVDGDGLVRAVGLGAAEIVANFGNVRGSATIQVIEGYHSSFDVSDEGWVAWENGEGPVEWQDGGVCGGGMGGCISLHDVASGWMAFRAPEDWRDGTDLSDYYGGRLIYYMRYSGGDQWPAEGWAGTYNIIIESQQYGRLEMAFPDEYERAFEDVWQRVSIDLSTVPTAFFVGQPAAWQLGGRPATEDEIRGVLSNVSDLLIRAEFAVGDDRAYLDEVMFTTEPAPPYSEFTEEMVTPIYVDDVVGAFNAIQDHGLFLEAHTNDSFDYGCCASDHIQGIQRLRGSNYFAVTASDGESSRVAIVHIASIPEAYITSSVGPPAENRVVKVMPISTTMKHAGGISASGDVVVVPIENGGASEIHFFFAPQGNIEDTYDLSDVYPNAIVSRDKTAGAVALTRFPSGAFQGRYLLAVLTHGSDGPLDFYLSRTQHLFDGFDPVVSWDIDDVRAGSGQDPTFDGHQNIDFVMQSDGAIYLLGTNNNWASGGGDDWGDLYRVEFANDDPHNYPTVTKVANRHFDCKDHGNFDGGAGIYVNHDGKLALYAIDRYTRPTVTVPHKLKMIGFGWPLERSEYFVELYDDKNFQDRRLLLNGTSGHFLGDYHLLYFDGQWGFNDKVSSVIWRLPPGTAYLLFENTYYGGVVVSLYGTGQVQAVSDLGGFSDEVSSSRFW